MVTEKETPVTVTSETSTDKTCKKTGGRVSQLQKELKDTNDKLIRAYAEMQNMQKRFEKELSSREESIKKKYLCEFIDLYDVLQKAYRDDDPKSGLQVIIKNIEQFFEHEHIKPIECVGKVFNHNIHHAITTVDRTDCEDGVIVEEVKKGYLIDEKLLRPSQVIVAKNKKIDMKMEGS
ncbi:MAG: nucleotide exchange factor GrpE [Candidatus Thermoplasmatota archaeon]